MVCRSAFCSHNRHLTLLAQGIVRPRSRRGTGRKQKRTREPKKDAYTDQIRRLLLPIAPNRMSSLRPRSASLASNRWNRTQVGKRAGTHMKSDANAPWESSLASEPGCGCEEASAWGGGPTPPITVPPDLFRQGKPSRFMLTYHGLRQPGRRTRTYHVCVQPFTPSAVRRAAPRVKTIPLRPLVDVQHKPGARAITTVPLLSDRVSI
jgi:hypothetical protein